MRKNMKVIITNKIQEIERSIWYRRSVKNEIIEVLRDILKQYERRKP